MKSYLLILCSIFAVGIFTACSSSNNTVSDQQEERSTILVKDLPEYINSIPRLSVQGYEVVNTATSTIRGNTSPLFVLDGIQMGRSLYGILNVLNENQTISVEFLKSSRATIRYGEEGRNGVILIKREQGN